MNYLLLQYCNHGTHWSDIMMHILCILLNKSLKHSLYRELSKLLRSTGTALKIVKAEKSHWNVITCLSLIMMQLAQLRTRVWVQAPSCWSCEFCSLLKNSISPGNLYGGAISTLNTTPKSISFFFKCLNLVIPARFKLGKAPQLNLR